jgi:hypothetical protein
LENWKYIFDKYPVLDSPMYHALRVFFGWRMLKQTPYILNEKLPCQEQVEEDGRTGEITI